MATETPPPLGALQLLANSLASGRALAAGSDVTPGNVQLWLAATCRSRLEKVFGHESPVLSLWPKYVTPVAEEDARQTLLLHIAKLEDLLEGVTAAAESALARRCVFIGHGRSAVWRELRDFLERRLSLPCEEFNSETVAGMTTTDRLHTMLANANFAFLVMTAEDEHADSTLHARENVVHEVGLFQGRLGLRRAIVLLEEGCQTFSNIHGLSRIEFPAGRILAAFEEIRQVLEREQIIAR